MGLTTMRVMQQANWCNRMKHNITNTKENAIKKLHGITRIQTNNKGKKTRIMEGIDFTTQDECSEQNKDQETNGTEQE